MWICGFRSVQIAFAPVPICILIVRYHYGMLFGSQFLHRVVAIPVQAGAMHGFFISHSNKHLQDLYPYIRLSVARKFFLLKCQFYVVFSIGFSLQGGGIVTCRAKTFKGGFQKKFGSSPYSSLLTTMKNFAVLTAVHGRL